MIANYTETLEKLLENQGYRTEEQSSALTEILQRMDDFPEFHFQTGQSSSISFSMLSLFMEKYDIREIGSETEELFMHFWREKTNELLIKYSPKIKMWLDNFNDLFKFTVQLKSTDELHASDQTYSSDSSENKNTYYLNPVNNRTENLKVSNVDKSEISGSGSNTKTTANTKTVTKDVLQSVWGKTRADIMSKIMDLKDIYLDCLNEYEVIFMGVH